MTAAAGAQPLETVLSAPALVANAHAVGTSASVAAAVVRAFFDRARGPAVPGVADALPSVAVPVTIALVEVGAAFVRAVISAKGGLANAMRADALAVARA